MKSSYHVSMYEKRGYFCICYRVHFTVYLNTIVNQQRIGEGFLSLNSQKQHRYPRNNYYVCLLKNFRADFLHLYVQSVKQPFIQCR